MSRESKEISSGLFQFSTNCRLSFSILFLPILGIVLLLFLLVESLFTSVFLVLKLNYRGNSV